MASVLPIPFPTDGSVQRKTSRGYLQDLLIPNSFDYDVFEDMFWGDAVNARYPAAKTNGTSAAVTLTEHTANGGLKLVSGTADNGYAGQGVGMNYTGDRGVLFEAMVTLPGAITTMKFEVGLSDADDDAGAVNVKATPNATATDYAVFVFDTDDDTTIAFHSAKNGTITATEGIVTAAVDTTYRFGIRVQDDTIAAFLNGVQVAGGSHVIEGGNALTPWAFCQARTGSASRTLLVKKWRVIQPSR